MILSSIYNRIFFITILVWLLLLAGCNQGKGPKEKYKEAMEEKEVTLNGIVIKFESNETGDVDELIIRHGDDTTALRFPPHTAQKIMDMAKPSSPVEAIAGKHRGPMDTANVYKLLFLQAGDEELVVSGLPPPPPQRGEAVSVTGKASGISVDREGKIRSFLVGNTLVILPPHVGMNVSKGLRDAGHTTVQGFKRAGGTGFVNIRAADVLRPTSITIDSITYTIE